MVHSQFPTAAILCLFSLACLVAAHGGSDSVFIAGASNSTPYGIPAVSWAEAIAHPNATYTLNLSGTNQTFSKDANLWNVSIAVAASVPLNGTPNTTLDQSQVFTGTRVTFVPDFLMDAPSDVEWEACFYFGAPGLPLNQAETEQLNGQDMCEALSPGCALTLGSAFFGGANTTGYLSCPDAAQLQGANPCANELGCNTPYMLSVNQTTAPEGGTLFEFGDVPYDRGNLTAYTDSVETFWPILSMWSIRTPNSTYPYNLESSLGCLFAATVEEGSYNFNSTAATSSPGLLRSLWFSGSVAALLML